MLIIHGDHLAKSRTRLVQEIESVQTTGVVIHKVDAAQLSIAELDSLLKENALFTTKKLIVVENLHSLPNSQRKKELVAMLAEWQKLNGADADTKIILWEKRTLTKTMLAQFFGAEQFEAKLSTYMFAWVEGLESNSSPAQLTKSLSLFDKTIDQDDAFFAFIMLARQIRLLLQIKEGGTLKIAPFMIQKIKKQAASFKITDLLQLHHQLLEIDRRYKTSRSYLDMRQNLDLFQMML